MRNIILTILLLLLIKPVTAVIVLESESWATRHPFDQKLSAKQWKIALEPGNATFRITQKNMPHSSLDRVAIFADGKIVRPKIAKQDGKNVMKKVGGTEKDVLDIHENFVEVMFEVPRARKYMLEVIANEYDDKGSILRSPRIGFAIAKVFRGTMEVDGKLDNNLGPYNNPIWWVFSNGRPQGYTYIWFRSDGNYLYAAVEITADNTNVGNQRASLILQMPDRGFEKFTIEPSNHEYGMPGFQYTSKVNWEHNIFEFKIPYKGKVNKIKYAMEYQLL